jgi:UTP--glucose-1-phosphate uridylyltransferase
MASAIKSALPSHLKPSSAEEQGNGNERRHGKTRSHMVSPLTPPAFSETKQSKALFEDS